MHGQILVVIYRIGNHKHISCKVNTLHGVRKVIKHIMYVIDNVKKPFPVFNIIYRVY